MTNRTPIKSNIKIKIENMWHIGKYINQYKYFRCARKGKTKPIVKTTTATTITTTTDQSLF